MIKKNYQFKLNNKFVFECYPNNLEKVIKICEAYVYVHPNESFTIFNGLDGAILYKI